jgi:hypothetical protein
LEMSCSTNSFIMYGVFSVLECDVKLLYEF